VRPAARAEASATSPFQGLHTGCAEVPEALGYAYVSDCSSVIRRGAAFPARRNDAKSAGQIVLKEFIPRYGVPEITDSGRGAHLRQPFWFKYVTL